MKSAKHMEGRDVGHILLYALSTCVWCKMTKKLLNELGVAYDYIDVDRLDEDEKETVMEELDHWNPSHSFPTLVINDLRPILGYDERKIREVADK